MRMIGTLTFFSILFTTGHLAFAQTAATPDASQYGWLEGTITNNQGQAIRGTQFGGDGKHIKGVRQGGGEFEAQTSLEMGGLYSVRNIKPGVYDITLEKGWIGNQSPYCPERIFGVVIKPGQRTVLNIVMDPGETYEEVGKPVVVTAPATNVTEELAQMQKQIDDLKQQVAALMHETKDAAGQIAPAPAQSAKP